MPTIREERIASLTAWLTHFYSVDQEACELQILQLQGRTIDRQANPQDYETWKSQHAAKIEALRTRQNSPLTISQISMLNALTRVVTDPDDCTAVLQQLPT